MCVRSISLICLVCVGLALTLVVGFLGHSKVDSPSDAIYRDGLAALQRTDYTAVRRAVQKLKSRPDAGVRGALLSAAYQLRAGHPDRALTEILSHRYEGDDRFTALMLAGESFYHLKDLAGAQQCFLRAETQSPESEDVHRWLAATYYDLGANGLARKHLMKLVELNRDDGSTHRLLGLIARDSDDHNPAIEHFRSALSKNLSREVRQEVLFELAQSQITQLDYLGALKTLEAASATGATHVLRAQCFFGLGDHQLAAKALRLAEPECQEEAPFLLLRARLAMAEGRWEMAIADLRRAQQLDRHNPEILYVLGVAYQRLGDVDQSRTFMQQSFGARNAMAQLSALSREAEARPGDAEVRDELARICERLGRTRLATMWRNAAAACRRAKAIEESETTAKPDPPAVLP